MFDNKIKNLQNLNNLNKPTYLVYLPMILKEVESRIEVKDKYSTIADLMYNCMLNQEFMNGIPEERPIIKSKLEKAIGMKLPRSRCISVPKDYSQLNSKWFVVFPIDKKLLIGTIEN